MRSKLGGFVQALVRRKRLTSAGLENTHLNRCLSTSSLTLLGIGSTLGLGIYVLAGEVASRVAGPAVCLSFAIAAIASVFAGLNYAEFGARVPKSGSAYVYSYVTVGEFMAFIIGWNLVLEYVIGTASVARGYSGYIDSLADGHIKAFWRSILPINVTGFSAYPDFLALSITLLLTLMLLYGVEESTRFNSIFTCINLLVVIFIVVAGSFHLNFDNWQLPANVTQAHNAGDGGFFPFGFAGMMSGAATCFYGFIGFDVIATTGEEAKNPQRSIPISIVLSLTAVFLAYFFVSIVQTLMFPYYEQTEAITQGAPLPYVFEAVGQPVAKWIISIGALTGLSTSLLGAMFPLPRVLYAMAQDGVIFRFLGNICERTKTPVVATLISGVFSGLMAAVFDVKELADMMSIGTLLAYTLVAISVLVIRYSPANKLLIVEDSKDVYEMQPLNNGNPSHKQKTMDSETDEHCQSDEGDDSKDKESSPSTSSSSSLFRQFFNLDGLQSSIESSSRIATCLIVANSTLVFCLALLLVNCLDGLYGGDFGVVSILIGFVILIFILTLALDRQPTCSVHVSFKVPLVPYIPLLSIFINFYLMLQLSTITWIRFLVWMIIGLLIYFTYGVWNSNERNHDDKPITTKREMAQAVPQEEPNSAGAHC